MTLRSVVKAALGTVLLSAGLVAATSSEAGALPAGVHRVISTDFPDPGFAKFGTFYYLYKTGAGFAASYSVSPTASFTTPRLTMYKPGHPKQARWPAWVGKSPDGAPRLWAPHVYGYADSSGHPHFVMYFTGWSSTRHANCIGVATATSALGNFSPQPSPVICGPKGYEAIDPTAYESVAHSRYLIYKISQGNVKNWGIRAVRMNATGTARSTTIRTVKNVVTPGARMEAPSVILHGHKIFLFTSRGNWVDCSYATDVWRADSFWTGTFTKVRTLMTTRSTRMCGPGGADVLADGSRIAFHAYPDANHNGVKDSSIRQAYVGTLTWKSGLPYLG